MPPVWSGRRRWLLVALATLGMLQAGLALLMAWAVNLLLGPATPTNYADLAALLGAVLGIGLARWIERVVAEDLGQDYVFEQRRRLMTSSIGSYRPAGSLGVTVTRASNDLTAVRNWVALGIVPLVTAVPLILSVLSGLTLLDWRVALAVMVPLGLVAAAVPFLAVRTLQRSRELRRRRGRMSARIADSVLAGESIRAFGAVRRELCAIDRDSARVVTAAVDRSWVTGLTRALTVTAASLGTVSVVLLAVLGYSEPAGVASTMTLLGVLATPMTDLGRVVEYRQNYRAAARILAPLMTQADELVARQEEQRANYADPESGHGEVEIRGLQVDGRVLPNLTARPGSRILIRTNAPERCRGAVRELVGTDRPGVVTIDGRDHALAPERVRRQLVGLASAHTRLERGSVGRLASYRMPDADPAAVRRVLEQVGLREKIEAQEKGLKLQLKNGGRPWSDTEVALLKLARAALGEPPLLIVEGLDNLLGEAELDSVRDLLAGYPGVVLFSSQRPGRLVRNYTLWRADGVATDDARVGGRGGVLDAEDDGE